MTITTHFEQEQFVYLIGRLRSRSVADSFLFATTNPDPDSWVYEWVKWYIDQDTGYPIEERCGKVIYFVVDENVPVFAETEEELAERYEHLVYDEHPVTGEMVYVGPNSLTFINGTIYDNPELMRTNPRYIVNLKAQGKVQRARLLHGNWHARAEGSSQVKRENIKKLLEEDLYDVADGITWVRSWDKAYNAPSDVTPYPDYTASVKMGRVNETFVTSTGTVVPAGAMILKGDYLPHGKDDKTEVIGRFRKNTGERDKLMLQQAELDGPDVMVTIPRESSGIYEFEQLEAMFNAAGFEVTAVKTTARKLARFAPFSSAVSRGEVFIVESSFTNTKTLNMYYKEIESFDGERSTSSKKDDWADASADAYNHLRKIEIKRPVIMPVISSASQLSTLYS